MLESIYYVQIHTKKNKILRADKLLFWFLQEHVLLDTRNEPVRLLTNLLLILHEYMVAYLSILIILMITFLLVFLTLTGWKYDTWKASSAEYVLRISFAFTHLVSLYVHILIWFNNIVEGFSSFHFFLYFFILLTFVVMNLLSPPS